MPGFSPALTAYLQRLDKTEPLLVLLEITAGPDTMRMVANNEDITFQGNIYTATSFVVDRPGANGSGKITTLPLKICNVKRIMRPYLEAYDGGVGLPVTITIINPALADEDYSELTATLYNLDTKSDNQWVYFQLGPINPLNRPFPDRQYLARHCDFAFKADPRCGYSGSATECDRSIDACRALGNSRRFGGHLGLDGRSLRIV